jgi:branched-chain amino acid transport system substrate-binding protein
MNRINPDMPVFDEIRTHVHQAGNAAGDGSNVGSVLYTRGMYAAMLAAEAIRIAQEKHGVADITPAMMRDGMEALAMTDARMAELGAPGIGPEFSVSCENHGGSGMGIVQQWNAADGKWVALTDYIMSDASVIDPLIEEDSMAFAAEAGVEMRCN